MHLSELVSELYCGVNRKIFPSQGDNINIYVGICSLFPLLHVLSFLCPIPFSGVERKPSWVYLLLLAFVTNKNNAKTLKNKDKQTNKQKPPTQDAFCFVCIQYLHISRHSNLWIVHFIKIQDKVLRCIRPREFVSQRPNTPLSHSKIMLWMHKSVLLYTAPTCVMVSPHSLQILIRTQFCVSLLGNTGKAWKNVSVPLLEPLFP